MSENVDWLDRSLLQSPIEYTLCISEKQFNKLLKSMGIAKIKRPTYLSTTHANATAHFFESTDTNKERVIICLGRTEGVSEVQIYGLLVHEAVHVWQRVREILGEDHPAKEQEAYAIQRIAQSLIESYREQHDQ